MSIARPLHWLADVCMSLNDQTLWNTKRRASSAVDTTSVLLDSRTTKKQRINSLRAKQQLSVGVASSAQCTGKPSLSKSPLPLLLSFPSQQKCCWEMVVELLRAVEEVRPHHRLPREAWREHWRLVLDRVRQKVRGATNTWLGTPDHAYGTVMCIRMYAVVVKAYMDGNARTRGNAVVSRFLRAAAKDRGHTKYWLEYFQGECPADRIGDLLTVVVPHIRPEEAVALRALLTMKSVRWNTPPSASDLTKKKKAADEMIPLSPNSPLRLSSRLVIDPS